MDETRSEKDRDDAQCVPTSRYTPTTEPQGPHNVRMKPEDVHYWHGLTPREMSIWSAGYRQAEIDYKIPEEDLL